MNSLLDGTDEHDDYPHSSHWGRDREITLGTTMILLIFFALAVYGAVLFGFGYSLGSKHTASTGPASAGNGSSASFSAFKPAPGSPIGSSDAGTMPATDTKPIAFAPPPPVTRTVTPAAEPAEVQSVSATPEEPHAKPAAPSATSAAALSPPQPVPVAPLVAGIPSVVVQIAALSHSEDAEAVASALKKRGYAVNIQTEADKLLHVQVGPFASRKDAEAMKARLLADGFNAYIK